MATAAYADGLRAKLMADLFDGEDPESKGRAGAGAAAGSGSDSDDGEDNGEAAVGLFMEQFASAHGLPDLPDLEKELEEFQGHEIVRAILDRGQQLKGYADDVDGQLRAAELDSIQDYLAESDNMVALHEQARRRPGGLALGWEGGKEEGGREGGREEGGVRERRRLRAARRPPSAPPACARRALPPPSLSPPAHRAAPLTPLPPLSLSLSTTTQTHPKHTPNTTKTRKKTRKNPHKHERQQRRRRSRAATASWARWRS